MIIQDIYKKYQIIPSLQLHQLRVASVAKMICESIKKPVDTHEVMAACLLHDMGNIIKFKMDLFPEFLEPEGVEYWSKIQQDYFDKYGRDEHVATMEIAKEIFSFGHPELDSGSQKSEIPGRARNDESVNHILELLDAIGFSNAKYNFEHDDFSRKIAAYADMRVEPHGVVSLEKRLEDGRKRFNIQKPGKSTDEFFNEMAGYLKKIEDQIFAQTSMKTKDITEESISKYIQKLKGFVLSS